MNTSCIGTRIFVSGLRLAVSVGLAIIAVGEAALGAPKAVQHGAYSKQGPATPPVARPAAPTPEAPVTRSPAIRPLAAELPSSRGKEPQQHKGKDSVVRPPMPDSHSPRPPKPIGGHGSTKPKLKPERNGPPDVPAAEPAGEPGPPATAPSAEPGPPSAAPSANRPPSVVVDPPRVEQGRVSVAWRGTDPDGDVLQFRYGWWKFLTATPIEWSNFANDTSMARSGVQPGRYQLSVQAWDGRGLTSPTVFAIIEVPPAANAVAIERISLANAAVPGRNVDYLSAGQTARITVTIKNLGDRSTQVEVVLNLKRGVDSVPGFPPQNQSATIAGRGQTKVNFDVTPPDPAVYRIEVEAGAQASQGRVNAGMALEVRSLQNLADRCAQIVVDAAQVGGGRDLTDQCSPLLLDAARVHFGTDLSSVRIYDFSPLRAAIDQVNGLLRQAGKPEIILAQGYPIIVGDRVFTINWEPLLRNQNELVDDYVMTMIALALWQVKAGREAGSPFQYLKTYFDDHIQIGPGVGPRMEEMSRQVRSLVQRYCGRTVVSITGLLQYEDRPYTASGFTGVVGAFLPARFVKVEILRGPFALATAYTDESGRFDFTLPWNEAPEGTLRFRVSAQSNAAVTVYDADQHLHQVELSPGVAIRSLLPPAVTLQVTRGGNESMAAALNIVDVCKKGYSYADSQIQVRPAPGEHAEVGALKVFWDLRRLSHAEDEGRGWERSAHYHRSTSTVDLARIDLPTNLKGWADDVILHEFGHHVMASLSVWAAPGGEHYYGEEGDLRLAWNEGWATYFSCAVRRAGSMLSPQEDGTMHEFKVEDVPTPLSDAINPYRREDVVAGVLWDLHDGANEEHDQVSVPDAPQKIWAVMDVDMDRSYSGVTVDERATLAFFLRCWLFNNPHGPFSDVVAWAALYRMYRLGQRSTPPAAVAAAPAVAAAEPTPTPALVMPVPVAPTPIVPPSLSIGPMPPVDRSNSNPTPNPTLTSAPVVPPPLPPSARPALKTDGAIAVAGGLPVALQVLASRSFSGAQALALRLKFDPSVLVIVGAADGAGRPVPVGNRGRDEAEITWHLSGARAQGASIGRIELQVLPGTPSGSLHIEATEIQGVPVASFSILVEVSALELPGDANGDRVVNIQDLQALQNVIDRRVPPTPTADLNADGRIDAADHAILKDMLLGRPVIARAEVAPFRGGRIRMSGRGLAPAPERNVVTLNGVRLNIRAVQQLFGATVALEAELPPDVQSGPLRLEVDGRPGIAPRLVLR